MQKYKHYLLAVLSGFLLYSGWSTWLPNIFIFIALIPLLFVEEEITKIANKYSFYTVFSVAWLSFISWNMLSIWWGAYATPAALAVPFINGAFLAFVFACYHLSNKHFGKSYGRMFLLVGWLAFEYIHHFWEWQFPWLVLGNSLAKTPELIQWYSITGTLGGSALIIFFNLSLFSLLLSIKNKTKPVWYPAAAALLLCAGLFSFSLLKKEVKSSEPNIEFAVIQPNIDPFAEKFSGLSPAAQLDLILHLADSVATPATKYFIAPETSITYPIWTHEPEKHPAYEPITKFLAKHPSSSLLIGAYTYSKVANPTGVSLKDTDGSWYNIHNSAVFYQPGGNVEIYHKSKLLIGPETIPWANMLNFLQKFSINLGGIVGSYTPQAEAEVLTDELNNAHIAPIICYESVFGEYTSEFVRKNANILAIITNDGWWGTSEGYRQHLRFSQLRAIESGKWVVRSANTGISCIISPSGKIVKQTAYGERTAFTYQVPLSEIKTYYSQTGDFIGRMAVLLTLILALYFVVQKITKRPIKN